MEKKNRLGKGTWAPKLSWTCWEKDATMGVLKTPGAMVITRMPCCDKSRAAVMHMPTMAPFDAEYAICPICPSYAATEAVLMITPRCLSDPSGSAFFTIRSADKRNTLNEPTTFTLKHLSNESKGCTTPFPLIRRMANPHPHPSHSRHTCTHTRGLVVRMFIVL